ncbi:MAG: PP2C family protein-serine/threonine phosphatase [Actinomycetota bacterium]
MTENGDQPTGTNESPAVMSEGERVVDDLLTDAHLAAAHELPGLVARHAATLGAADALAFLADLQQYVLVPFFGSGGSGVGGPGWPGEPMSVDSTLAGRCFQHVEVLTQDAGEGRTRVWLPLLNGTERLGVLGVTFGADSTGEITDGVLGVRLIRFAALVAELITTKSQYGDTIARLRRREGMGLAAEMQWALLPPLTFAGHDVTISAALEPAYEVAGDAVDYAVDAGRARAALFDGMGHGLRSAQLAALTIASYRNARRAGNSLIDIAVDIHRALIEASFGGTSFSTAVIAELDTDTGLLSWVNAGHPDPLLLRDNKMVKSLHAAPWLPLGLQITNRTPVTSQGAIGREQLQPGDRVLMYTDGVTEARSPDGEFFGEERLIDLMVRNLAAGLPSPETMRRAVRALLDHQQDRLTDDATLLLLEWRHENTSALLAQ